MQDPFEAWGDATVGSGVGGSGPCLRGGFCFAGDRFLTGAALMARVVGNVDENCDKYVWKVEFAATKADISRCVRSWGVRNGFGYLQALGPIVSVVIAKRNGVTGRPTELELTDAAGRRAPMRAEEFRLA